MALFNTTPIQTIDFKDGADEGIAAGGPYLFVPDDTDLVLVYTFNSSTGLFALTQTITTHTGNGQQVLQASFDSNTGYLVLDISNNALELWGLSNGVFVFLDVAISLPGISHANSDFSGGCNISGTNIVVSGRDLSTGNQLFAYFTISAASNLVPVNTFNNSGAPDANYPNFYTGRASFSGNYLLAINSSGNAGAGTHVAEIFQLSGGTFSLMQTLPLANYVRGNILGNGWMFLTTHDATPVFNIWQLIAGVWTFSQQIAAPVIAANTPFLNTPYSYFSTALGGYVLMLSGSYSVAPDNIWMILTLGSGWSIVQQTDLSTLANSDPWPGVIGTEQFAFWPSEAAAQEAMYIFVAGTSSTITLGLKGMKVYAQ